MGALMRPCPQCGTPCPDASETCSNCHAPLTIRPNVPAPGAFKGTMIGMAPNLAQTLPLSAAPHHDRTLPLQPNPGRTLPLQPSEPPPAGNTSSSPPLNPALRGTMIGMAPPEALAPAKTPAARLGATMIGIAPLGSPVPLPTATVGLSPGSSGHGSVPPVPSHEHGAPRHESSPAPAAPAASATAPLRKTILGVARPGIAPMNPGQLKEPLPAPAGSLPQLTPDAGASWQGADFGLPPPDLGPLPVRPPLPIRTPRRIPALAALSIVAAAALFTAAAVALLLHRSRGAMEAKLVMDGEGREQLELLCRGCDDGVKATLGNVSATFQGGRAALLLDRKLPVGPNRVAVEIERAPGRTDSVELAFPVEYRVRADIAGLEQTPPRLTVRVQALSGTAVVVEGKPVVLAPDGTGNAEIPVAKELTGSEPGLRSLERRIPYVITPPGGAPASGEVSVRIGITPLLVQAPGPSIVIDTPTFVLSGRTAKGATVTVEGRPITVDAAGGFAQIMSVSAPGETNVVVRASAPEHAPRLVPIRVRRVLDLAAEAATVRASATSSFAALGGPDEKKGLSVALDGSVIEARTESFVSILLLDVKSGCTAPPCLARVSLGSKLSLAENENVSVFGTVAGSVEGPKSGTRIPEIHADFVVKGRK